MPELFSKPFEQRFPNLSVEAVNQLLRALPRVITGDGVLLKKVSDRWIIQKTGEYVYASPEIQYFVVMEEFADYLSCVVFSYASTIQPYDEDLGPDLQAQGLTGVAMYVAKPPWLQQSIWDGATLTIDGIPVSYTYTNESTRQVIPDIPPHSIEVPLPGRAPKRTQMISPPYSIGTVIVAKIGPTGLSYEDEEGIIQPIMWQDVNDAGRTWQDNSLPQILTIVTATPYETNGQKYYNAVWNLRNNSAFDWAAQESVWVQDLSDSTTLTVDSKHIGVFAGIEASGPDPLGLIERPLFQIQSTPSAPSHGCVLSSSITQSIPSTNSPETVLLFLDVVRDTDSYYNAGKIRIPTGLGGWYLVGVETTWQWPLTVPSSWATIWYVGGFIGSAPIVYSDEQHGAGAFGGYTPFRGFAAAVPMFLSDNTVLDVRATQFNSGSLAMTINPQLSGSRFWIQKID